MAKEPNKLVPIRSTSSTNSIYRIRQNGRLERLTFLGEDQGKRENLQPSKAKTEQSNRQPDDTIPQERSSNLHKGNIH